MHKKYFFPLFKITILLILLSSIFIIPSAQADSAELFVGIIEPITMLATGFSEHPSNKTPYFAPLGFAFIGSAYNVNNLLSMGATVGTRRGLQNDIVLNVFYRADNLLNSSTQTKLGAFSSIGLTRINNMVVPIQSEQLATDETKKSVTTHEAAHANYWHFALGPRISNSFNDDIFRFNVEFGAAFNLGSYYYNDKQVKKNYSAYDDPTPNHAERDSVGFYAIVNFAWVIHLGELLI